MNPQSKIIDLKGGVPHVYSASQLQRLVDTNAKAIMALNKPKGSGIALLGENSIEYVATFLAIQQTHHIAVPLNHKLPADVLQTCMTNANVSHVINEHIVSNIDNAVTLPVLDNDRVVYSLFTSGSSGAPKKVNFTYKERYKPHSANNHSIKTLSASPLYHIAGINWLENNLVAGNHLFMMPKFNAIDYANTIAKFKIESLYMVAPMMMMLLREKQLLTSLNLTSVREIALTSAPITTSAIDEIKKYFPNANSITNYYGLTEAGGTVFGAHPNKVPLPLGSVGYPKPQFKLKLINDVLQVNDFDTGDKFTVDANGFYYYIGRADSMFKNGGEKVYPREVELVLETHPSIDEAAVIGVPDPIKGFKPQAFVTVNRDISEQDLKTWCTDKLAPYQIPKTISIIDAMPKTAIGKINYNELKK